MPVSQGVGRFNMPGPSRIFVWSPIMPMRKVFRSHETIGGGESAPAEALERHWFLKRWHDSIRSMRHCSNRLLQTRLPFYIRSGYMPIRLLGMLTWCRHHRHKTGDSMDTTGRLEAIWLKRMRRGPMDAVERAVLQAQQGLVGNTDQGGRRQRTALAHEVWQALMAQVGSTGPPSIGRPNLLLSGIRPIKSRQRILGIGACRIRILGETKPCERMEEACPGLQKAMYDNWAGGAFGEVLDDGEIVVGAPGR